MPVSRALRRLLRIRDLEEEQSKIAFESAMGELHRLEGALASSHERERAGRHMILTSARSGDLPERLTGMEEIVTAQRFATVLTPRIANQEEHVALRREAYLDKRVERRQAETLIEETEARDGVEENRRTQRMLDDWFGSRNFRQDATSTHGEQSQSESSGMKQSPGKSDPQEQEMAPHPLKMISTREFPRDEAHVPGNLRENPREMPPGFLKRNPRPNS